MDDKIAAWIETGIMLWESKLLILSKSDFIKNEKKLRI